MDQRLSKHYGSDISGRKSWYRLNDRPICSEPVDRNIYLIDRFISISVNANTTAKFGVRISYDYPYTYTSIFLF